MLCHTEPGTMIFFFWFPILSRDLSTTVPHFPCDVCLSLSFLNICDEHFLHVNMTNDPLLFDKIVCGSGLRFPFFIPTALHALSVLFSIPPNLFLTVNLAFFVGSGSFTASTISFLFEFTVLLEFLNVVWWIFHLLPC